MADNFKAHRGELGPKLGASQASGPTGLARRIELAREREVARRRGDGPTEGASPSVAVCHEVEQSGAERGTKGEGAAVKADLAVSTGKRPAHRPRVIGEPWAAEGLSRAQWYRRRKKGDGG